jgi:hypothetical protein
MYEPFMVRIDGSALFLKVVFPLSFVLIFGALYWRCFEDDFLGSIVGVTYEVCVPLWLVTLPPKSLSNRTRFGGFSSWASS